MVKMLEMLNKAIIGNKYAYFAYFWMVPEEGLEPTPT